jgi:membrane protease YdiL (CAAX protease family)
LTGFLTWQSFRLPNLLDALCGWWENVLTVAITEEIFFRVVLMNGINQGITKYNKFGWIGLLVSATVFGLMHLPRRSDIVEKALYGTFAFISGFTYGGAYIVSGNNIVAAVICHSFTDAIWSFLF